MISGPLLLARALLANVRFAVLQIGVIALASTVGIALRQLPDYALQNAGDYANEMAKLRAEYEPTLGPLVGVFERLGLCCNATTKSLSLFYDLAHCAFDFY